MPTPRRVFVALVALLGFAAEARARADGTPLAEALFEDGRELLDRGKTAEACAKFAASQHIEPKLGTLLNLAVCHEAEGKTASAWAEFKQAEAQADRANQGDREELAHEHATALAPKLSRVSIEIAHIDALKVSIDGVDVDSAVLGTAFPVDPGAHTLAFSAPGKKTRVLELVVPAAPNTTVIRVPALDLASPPPGAPSSQILAHEIPNRPSPIPGGVALAVGAISLGMGTYFGIRAFSKKQDAELECQGSACTQRGLDLFADSSSAGTISTFAFGIGVVAIGAGAYLLLRSTGQSRRASITPTRGIGGSW